LTKGTVAHPSGTFHPTEQTAARVLVEEVKKRTGLTGRSTSVARLGVVIAISWVPATPAGAKLMRVRSADLPEHRPEGFRLIVEGQGTQPTSCGFTARTRAARYLVSASF